MNPIPYVSITCYGIPAVDSGEFQQILTAPTIQVKPHSFFNSYRFPHQTPIQDLAGQFSYRFLRRQNPNVDRKPIPDIMKERFRWRQGCLRRTRQNRLEMRLSPRVEQTFD
jgi:hypothetical protein